MISKVTRAQQQEVGYIHYKQFSLHDFESFLLSPSHDLASKYNANEAFCCDQDHLCTLSYRKIPLYDSRPPSHGELVYSRVISHAPIDLRFLSPSNTGFGYYSGVVQLDEGLDVSGYELRAEIQGNSVITIVNFAI